jgi:hypothetical protein
MKPFTLLKFLALLPACVGSVDAQTTAFTYQGRVMSNGTNFTGTGQFKFALVTATNVAATATAAANPPSGGFITLINVTFGGNGYVTPPAVTISGGGGSGAAAIASVSGGAVTSITVNNPGSGYSSTPLVTVAPPPPTVTYSTYWSNDGTSANGSEPATAESVPVNNGLFTARLGDPTQTNMSAFPAGLFLLPNLELRIWFNNGVSGFAALSPTQPLSAAPYAMAAANLTGTVATSQLTGQIPPASIGAGTISTTMIAPGAVGSNQIAAGAVGSSQLAAGAVGSAQIAAGAVGSSQIAAGAVGTSQISPGAVGSTQIAAGAVGSSQLAPGAVGSNQIAAGAVGTAQIAPGAVGSAQLAAGAVGSGQIAAGAVGSSQLALGAVAASNLVAATGWFALTTLTKPNPAPSDSFGSSVAAVGTDRLLISAPYDDTGATDAGAAYLFSLSGALLTTFTNPTPAASELFGTAVASVGTDRVLVGAPQDSTGAPAAGAAYLFDTNAMLLTTITNPTPAVGDLFGYAVAAVGSDRVLIGAPLDDTGATDSGAAYLFNTNGALLTTFTNPTPAASDYFGVVLAAAGTGRVLISAPYDSTGATNAGAVYLFSTNGTLLTTFTNPTPAAGDYFGSAVAAFGNDRVLIGASGDSTGATNAGAAYLFSTNGALLTTFTNPTPAAGDRFGGALAAMGIDRVLIGAAGDSTGAANAGAAYLFSTNGTLLSTITNPAPAANDSFGSALAVAGTDRLLICAPYASNLAPSAGAAYLFSLGTFTPGLVADAVRAGSVTTASLEDGAVTAAKLDPGIGIWTRSGGNVFRPSGSVGIGTATPGFLLEVNGTAGKPGGGSWSVASDERLKKNVRPLAGALEKLLALHGVNFEYIDPARIHELAGERMGLLAQEVERVFPDWVESGADGYKRVTVRGLEALVVEALRELRQEQLCTARESDAAIHSLKRKLTEDLDHRDAENLALREEVADLKAQVRSLIRRQE